MTKAILSLASLRTAARCWIPAYSQLATSRFFSSRQRCVNFNNVDHDTMLVANDDTFLAEETITSEPAFEPSVFSSEEVYTAGPVKKA